MMRISSRGLVCLVLSMLVVVCFFCGSAQATNAQQTLFTTQTPALPNVQVGPHELGTEFKSSVSGRITAIRFWKSGSETGQHVGHIWSASGQLLASATFVSETASGWQQQSLPSPLAIAANTVYVVSVNTGGIYYAATTSGLASSVVNQNLSTVVGNNGVYGAPGQFPTQSYSQSNYFRDIVFSPGSGLPPTGGSGQQQMSVVPVSVSFGSVTVGTANTQTVTVSNPGSANLSISQATVSGSGFALSGLTLPLTVAPGTSAAFTVKFAPAAVGSVTGSLTLLSNAPNSPTTVALSGTGATVSVQLAASPSSLSYGNVNLGTTSSKTVTLTNSGNSSVSISQLSVSGAGFTASGLTTPLSLTPGQSTAFNVNFAPTVGGSVSGSASVASNATGSPTQIALTGSGVQAAPAGPLAAFPGAQGGGALSVGGRGGMVYEVTNLSDSGAGSLRACIDASGRRTCIFRVGGTISLRSGPLQVLNPYITIAGQTAPGGGIQINFACASTDSACLSAAGGSPAFSVRTHDVIVQYLRIRRGHNAGEVCNQSPWTCGQSAEILSCCGNTSDQPYNIIYDHVSAEWSNYDAIGVTGSDKTIYPNMVPPHSITLSHMIVGEELAGAGQVVAGNFTTRSGQGSLEPDQMRDIDVHHSLIAGATHRYPLDTVYSGRFVNNIIYGWTYYAMHHKGFRDIIGNYFKLRTAQTTIPSQEIQTWTSTETNDTSYPASFYLRGNIGPNDPGGTNNWAMTGLAVNESTGGWGAALPTSYQRTAPLAVVGTAITADAASAISSASGSMLNIGRAAPYDGVGASRKLDCNGNWLDARDSVDARITNAVVNGTTLYGSYGYTSLTDAPQSQADLGGFPTLAAGTPCTDSDHDGIPDAWAINHGFSATANIGATTAPNGYTYLENYLNGTDPSVTASITPTSIPSLWASLSPKSRMGSFLKENQLDGTEFSRSVNMKFFDLTTSPWFPSTIQDSAALRQKSAWLPSQRKEKHSPLSPI